MKKTILKVKKNPFILKKGKLPLFSPTTVGDVRKMLKAIVFRIFLFHWINIKKFFCTKKSFTLLYFFLFILVFNAALFVS